MPAHLLDDWGTPRRPTGGGGVRPALIRALERGVPRAIGPALVAASAMLLAGQLFSAYRTVWPADNSGQFQQGTADLSIKVAYVIGSYFTVPLISTSLPVLILAGLGRLPSGSGLPVGPRLRLAAGVTALVVTLAGVVLFVGVGAWTLITRGEVGSPSDGMGYFAVDPLSTFLSRGGDGLATAVLAGAACWLVWTAVVPSDADDADDTAPRGEGEAVADKEPPARPTTRREDTGSAKLPDPQYRLGSVVPGSVVPGSPAPFVTRGGSEPAWQHPDATVFRRPSAGTDPGPEPMPEDAEPASTDPARLYRRPVG